MNLVKRGHYDFALSGLVSQTMTLRIAGESDGGNVRVRQIHADGAELEILPDHRSGFYQWFNFRVSGAAGRKLTLRFRPAWTTRS